MTSVIDSTNLVPLTPNSHGVTIPFLYPQDPSRQIPGDLINSVKSCREVGTLPASANRVIDTANGAYTPVASGVYEVTFEIPFSPDGLIQSIVSPLCEVSSGETVIGSLGLSNRQGLLEFSLSSSGNLEINSVCEEYSPEKSLILFLIPEGMTVGNFNNWHKKVCPSDPWGYLDAPLGVEPMPFMDSYLVEDLLENFSEDFNEYSNVYNGYTYWGKISVGGNTYLITTHGFEC